MYRVLKKECQEKNDKVCDLVCHSDRGYDKSDRENLKHVRVFEKHEGDSGKNILPCMCHHSRAQSVSPERKHTKHRAIYGDGNHAACAFVSMRDAEEQ